MDPQRLILGWREEQIRAICWVMAFIRPLDIFFATIEWKKATGLLSIILFFVRAVDARNATWRESRSSILNKIKTLIKMFALQKNDQNPKTQNPKRVKMIQPTWICLLWMWWFCLFRFQEALAQKWSSSCFWYLFLCVFLSYSGGAPLYYVLLFCSLGCGSQRERFIFVPGFSPLIDWFCSLFRLHRSILFQSGLSKEQVPLRFQVFFSLTLSLLSLSLL